MSWQPRGQNKPRLIFSQGLKRPRCPPRTHLNATVAARLVESEALMQFDGIGQSKGNTAILELLPLA